ncbi:DEKNAAC101604 [Brettanomyces naardenensis]|uniref:DEKNAAC101604 n=1 Tax=Brettanomyces naardenensis TaxID=13370 RepID=A0A448YII3_BRENA|nr:DEKNAAC101604 [Brettanomyces naardenensis]
MNGLEEFKESTGLLTDDNVKPRLFRVLEQFPESQLMEMKKNCHVVAENIGRYQRQVTGKRPPVSRKRSSLAAIESPRHRPKTLIKRHSHSKSDTMTVGTNGASKKIRDRLNLSDKMMEIGALEQLEPGETVTLRVEPYEADKSDTSKTEFTPQGVLQQDLGIKPKLKCLQCGSESTPEWRKGPGSVPTLCNACGLFHNKLVRKVGREAAENFMRGKREEGRPGDRQLTVG